MTKKDFPAPIRDSYIKKLMFASYSSLKNENDSYEDDEVAAEEICLLNSQLLPGFIANHKNVIQMIETLKRNLRNLNEEEE